MSGIRDEKTSLSWAEVEEQIAQEKKCAPTKAQFLEGENSIEYAIKLLAAGEGFYPAMPIHTRWTNEEKQALIAELKNETLTPGIYVSTSGSAGSPKLVQLSPESLQNHAESVCEHLKVTADDTWLLCLPMFHVGGLTILFRCRQAGASVRIVPNSDAEIIYRIIEAENITLISLVSTTLRRLLDLRRDKPFPNYLRAILVGGGPVAEDLIERCPIALQTYGLTEAGSMLTCVRPNADEIERKSAGVPIPGVELWIENENGDAEGVNEAGMIFARTPGMFSGYWNKDRPAHLSSPLIAEGKLRTGDFGYRDEFGYLHIVSRREDLIVSGGENIAPAEIEKAILEHGSVSECVVVAITDREWGQVPAAMIVLNEKSRLTEDELRLYLSSRLSEYKLPKRFIFAEEIPLLATGKVDRKRIKNMLEKRPPLTPPR